MATCGYCEATKAVLDEMFTQRGIKASKAFGYPAYKANGQVFAFVGASGLILKLPVERIQRLRKENPHVRILEVEPGVFWQGWVSIHHRNPQDFWQYQALAAEAIHYVGQLPA